MAIQDEVPKSRLTLRYKTEVNGTPENLTLPLRLMVLGDLSLGTSKDRKIDFDEREVRNLNGQNTSAVMKDMGMNLEFVVPNHVDPENNDELKISMPIDGMKAFSPEQIAENVPKLRGLLLMKRLLAEVQANVANSKEFRTLLSELYSNEDAFKKVMDELKGFEDYKLPSGEKAAGEDAPAPAAEG